MPILLGFIICLYPKITSPIALLLGITISLVFGNPYLARAKKLTKPLLAWAIIGLGAGVNLGVVVKAGTSGIVFTFLSLTATLIVGHLIGKWLKTDSETSTLLNVGTAICGGSAIVAVSNAIQAKDNSTSIALAVVFILNAIALLIFPTLGHHFRLSEDQFGHWAALAIHDTSSVVGASMQFGTHALEVGTTVKLVRALWIIPVTLLFAKIFNRSAKIQFPFFILGFVFTSALVTYFEFLQPIGNQVEWIARRALVIALYLIGSGLTMASIRAVGAKAIAQGILLWILVMVGSFFAVT